MSPSEKKYFPIKTTTACQWKWGWSTIMLNSGTTYSCHRASESFLTKENFNNFHNTERKLADRQRMLNGQWPGHGCEYCKTVEEAGGTSDRLYNLQVPGMYPKELDTDATLTNVNPTYLELFFKNTCNLACIYCRGALSSRIDAEDKKFGKPLSWYAEDARLEKDRYDEFIGLLWKWLETGYNYNTLRKITVLGGEPFYIDDFYKLLEFIETHPNQDLELSIITNLIVKSEILENFVDKIKNLLSKRHLKSIDILVSVDCWGPQQEYIRYGFDCDKFDKNIKYLLNQKFISVTLLSTITSLSINSMPQLAEKYLEWVEINDMNWSTATVLPDEQHVLDYGVLDSRVYKESLDTVNSVIANVAEKNKSLSEIFYGIKLKVEKTDRSNLEKQKNLLIFLNEVDQRRNLNWRITFPWLEEEFKKCGIVE